MSKWLEIYRTGLWRGDFTPSLPLNLETYTWYVPSGERRHGRVELVDSQGWVLVTGENVPNGMAWANIHRLG